MKIGFYTHLYSTFLARVNLVCVFIFISILTSNSLSAQSVALKNNLLYDAMLTPNLAVDVRLAPQWSLDIQSGFNPFPLNDTKEHKWRHLSVSVAPKYWFCETFRRGFVSANMAYAHYNVANGAYPLGWMYKQVKTNRFQGDALLFGVSGGWHFNLSKHLSFELEAGIDVGHTWFDRYECKHCGKELTTSQKRWFAMPKAAVNFVVLIGSPNRYEHRDCGCDKMEQIDEPSSQQVDTVPVIAQVQKIDTILLTLEPIIMREIMIDTTPNVIDDNTLEEEQHQQLMRNLRSNVFRPIEEYIPYSRERVLSSDTSSLYIHFDLGNSLIDADYMHNGEILDTIISIVSQMMNDSTTELKVIQLVGMASFDGKLSLNENLAKNRALALRKYIQQRVSLPNDMFELGNGGEGWSELRWYIEQREFDGKQQILDIIDSESDLERREQKIKALNDGQTYEYLKRELLKYQRNSGWIKVYYKINNNIN